jgi:hypothetical protein
MLTPGSGNARRRRGPNCVEGPVPTHYVLTVKGQPGEVLRAAFEDVVVSSAPGVTILSAELDQAGLHGLLGRIEDLGLELLDMRLVSEGAATSPRAG